MDAKMIRDRLKAALKVCIPAVWMKNKMGTVISGVVERCSTVVERRTLNRGSPGSNHICCLLEAWAYSSRVA